MKKWRKLTALALAFALTLTLLASCGPSGSRALPTEPVHTAPVVSEPIATDDHSESTMPPAPETTPPLDQGSEYTLTKHTYTVERTDGYSYEWVLQVGQWVKASDTEAIERAWNAVGGKGDAPNSNDFGNSGYRPFKANTSTMVFGTMSLNDTTPGGFKLADASSGLNMYLIGGEIGRFSGSNGKEIDAYIYYSNGSVEHLYSRGSVSLDSLRIWPNITGRTWGPVPFVICCGGVFSPEHPDGDPEIFNASWSFGDDDFYVYPSWMDWNSDDKN